MKKVLIVGEKSYIGESFAIFVEDFDDIKVDIADSCNEKWKEVDLSQYDTIFHVAGIAHQKETEENAELYFKVNRDLAYEVASFAKKANIKQFVFMSSMSVYGLSNSKKIIDADTEEKPNTNYGKSKLEAEFLLAGLSDESFKVAVLRPPMVYGDGCPGNYTRLINAVKKCKIFPKFSNQRSSITIECLCESIYQAIINDKNGILIPQNANYLCTYEVVKTKMAELGVKVWFTKLFNLAIKILIGKVGVVSKAFGNLCYDKSFVEKQLRGKEEQ